MTLNVYVDWDRDGTFTSALDDVSGYVVGTLEAAYGRDQVSALAPTSSGTGSLTLNNITRRFSPRSTASPLYGKLMPARPVLVTRTIPNVSGGGTTTYTIFNGHTDDQSIDPDLDQRTASLSLVDWIADFRELPITTPLYFSSRTGDLINAVLDAAGWTGARDIDAGSSIIDYWWADNSDALSTLQSLVIAEGPPALLTVGTDGGIVFRDRHHRITRTASTVSQGTWRGLDSSVPKMIRGFQVSEGWSGIVNSPSQTVDVRGPGADVSAVWSLSDPFFIAAGEQRLITATLTDPATAVVTPDTVTGDLAVDSGSVVAYLLRDSGVSIPILLSASSDTWITGITLRGISYPVRRSVKVSALDSASRTNHGTRGYPVTVDWGYPGNVAAIMSAAVAQRANGLPTATVTFEVGSAIVATNPAHAHAVLSRNIGDRITLIEPESGLNMDFYVESIRHVLAGEASHRVTFGCEGCPAQPVNVFMFDVAGRGFDQGVFGIFGLDNPATVFRFDTAGQGFDQGVWAT